MATARFFVGMWPGVPARVEVVSCGHVCNGGWRGLERLGPGAGGGGQFKKFTTKSSSKALPLFYILLRVNIDVII